MSSKPTIEKDTIISKGNCVYIIKEFISKGGYGEVYKVINNERVYALKKFFSSDEEKEGGIPYSALREIAAMKRLRSFPSRFVVKIVDVIMHEGCYLMLMEFMPTNLLKVMTRVKRDNPEHPYLPPAERNRLLLQLLWGLDHIHQHQMVHRDLKPENLLVDKELNLKIADYGLARNIYSVNKRYSNEVQTFYYRAPELILKESIYSTKIDMWALGVIWYQLLTGDLPFKTGGNDDEFYLLCYMVGKLGHRDQVAKTSWFRRADRALQHNMERVLREQKSESLILDDERIPIEERRMLVRIFDWEPENRPSAHTILTEFFNQPINK